MSLEANPLLSDWLRAEEGRVVLRTGKVDIGQRISTALLRIASEELTLPPERFELEPVRTGVSPDEGITSGSNSIEQSGHAMRRAAATLRETVLRRAAERLSVAVESLDLADGIISHRGTNRTLALTDLARDLPPDLPVDPHAPPIPADRRRDLSGLAPRGLRDMVEGRFAYVHDLEAPGMLHARVVRPPHARARLRGFDDAMAERLSAEGMRVVRDGGFIAVAGPREWPVLRAAQRLGGACDWDPGEGLPELDVFDALRRENAIRLAVIDGKPDPDAPVPDPLTDPDHAARFERPYQMHGALAPSAAMATWHDGRLEIHTHSQGIYPLRDSIADSLGMRLEDVELVHCPGSGCYGHNGADDAAFEAALIARAIPGTPILLKWTREEEHAWEPYAPAMAVEIAARLDGSGGIERFSAEAFSDTHRGRPRPGPDRAGPARLLANRLRETPIGPYRSEPNMGRHAGMHRNLDPAYAFAGRRLVKNLVKDLPMRTSAMRCLGAVANVFALESFMDELAGRAGEDPVHFRLRHLQDPRARAVLSELDRRLTPAKGARGIAYSQYKNAMARVAIAIDITVDDEAQVRPEHALIVADAGRIVDPDGLRAQLEGGLIQALSWALCEEVRWDRDGILTRDWVSYPVIRFDRIPRIEVAFVETPEDPPLGAGEAAPGPAVAAIANAVHAAIGLRLRRLPFTPDAIMARALEE